MNPPWLITGPRSGTPIVTVPDSFADTAHAVIQVDEAMSGLPGPEPGWFRRFRALGRWWYLICIVVVGLVVIVATDAPAWQVVAGGIVGGALVALIAGAALELVAWRLAHRATRKRDRDRPSPRNLARPAPPHAPEQVAAILRRDPGLDARLHDIVWRAAATTGTDAKAADSELQNLWKPSSTG